MTKPLLILSLALLAIAGAQNLVPNPSFETITSCPPGNSGISAGYCTSWGVPSGSITTPDLFHSCGTVGIACGNINVPGNNFGGTSTAFQGNAYAGVMTYYTACSNCREYITAALISSMVAGTTYKIRAWTKLAPLSRYGNNRVGIQISSAMLTQPGGNQPILLTPTVEYPGQILDKTNWTLIQGLYTATGGENRITIGNFYNNGSTSIFDFGSSAGACALVTSGAIYYFDSISVQPAGPLDASFVSLGATWKSGQYTLSWQGWSSSGAHTYRIEADAGSGFFTPIGEVNALPGQQVYEWMPGSVQGTGTRYRVAMEDITGGVYYSEVVEYQSLPEVFSPVFTWYPNPAGPEVNVYTGEGFPEMPVMILDAHIRTVWQGQTRPDVPVHTFLIGELPSGMYVADVFDGTIHHHQRLLIQ